MQVMLELLQREAPGLFAATIIVIVFFLIARIAHARQPVALAFAFFPLLLTWAAEGMAAQSGILALL